MFNIMSRSEELMSKLVDQLYDISRLMTDQTYREIMDTAEQIYTALIGNTTDIHITRGIHETHYDTEHKMEIWYYAQQIHRRIWPAVTEYDEFGNIVCHGWYKYGNRHRDGLPAFIQYYWDGSIRYEEWYHDGELHRTNGPAIICYDETGAISSQQWYSNSKLHRINGPAVIHYDGGIITKSEWYYEGQLHREDGPAVEGIYLLTHEGGLGPFHFKQWYKEGVMHRPDGAADQWFSKDYCIETWYIEGQIRFSVETWYKDGKRHRLDGPAEIIFQQDHQIHSECYYFEGKLHSDGCYPTVTKYDSSGNITSMEWYKHGKLHHDTGAAKVVINPDNINKARYYEHHYYHNGDPCIGNQPTCLVFDQRGSVQAMFWLEHTKIKPRRGAQPPHAPDHV